MHRIALVVAVLTATGFVNAQDAVQWEVEDGGNGHWYQVITTETGFPINQPEAYFELAESLGGYAVSITSLEEDLFVYDLSVATPGAWEPGPGFGPVLGGRSTGNCDFWWLSGDAWGYTSWGPADPGCNGNYVAYCICGQSSPNETERWWIDCDPSYGGMKSGVIEWSADCNGDGIVDYGQILDGSLSDDNNNGIPDQCELDHLVPDDHPTIQSAIDSTPTGTVIQVRPGIYTENISSSSPVILRSTDGPESTIIDGNQQGTVMQLSGGEPHSIIGFTITNGVGPANTAGGILVSGGTHLKIHDCLISNNIHQGGEYGGGGLKINVGSLDMQNCTFDGNNSNWNGAGIYIWNSCCVYITDCEFINHGYDGTEGGPLDVVHFQFGSTVTMTGCVFDGNRFKDSECVVWDGSSATVTACEFLNAEQTVPSQTPEAGSVFSGSGSSLSIGSNFACGHPEPHVTIGYKDLGENEFTDAPCESIVDCNSNGIEDADDIANGTSQDCNANDIPDECDLTDGTSGDCNANGIPDECESLNDCNANGIPDACESLGDCDGDGTPDVCEILNGAIDANPADGIPDSCQGLPLGACCVSGACVLTTVEGCFSASGTYAGSGTECSETNCPTYCEGDSNQDGEVDVFDLLKVIDDWGGTCP